jgi:hypothetical protein
VGVKGASASPVFFLPKNSFLWLLSCSGASKIRVRVGRKGCMYIKGLFQTNFSPLSNLTPS